MKLPTPEELAAQVWAEWDLSPEDVSGAQYIRADREAIAAMLIIEADDRENPVFKSALEIVAEWLRESIR